MDKKFKRGDIVTLIEDPHKEKYTVVEPKGTSKGPMGQFPEVNVYSVLDAKGRSWQFREDALKLKIGDVTAILNRKDKSTTWE